MAKYAGTACSGVSIATNERAMQILCHPLYLAPIPLYAHICAAEKVFVDTDTPFTKQTYRNRAIIATESGTQVLTIPVMHNGVQPMRDVRISEHGNWRHQHWNAISSAYRKSPFFDYYADDFAHFYEEKDGFLIDFNLRLHATICSLLGIETPVVEATKSTLKTAENEIIDLRPLATPEALARCDMAALPYYQVFAQRNGFIGNLSIADLLFNMGPEGLIILSQQRI